MTARRCCLVLVLSALVAGVGAVASATSEPHHALVAYAEPVARLSQRDIYLRANRGQYALQKSHGFRPRADVSPFPLKLPLDWAADPFGDRNWQFQLHAWRMIDPIIYEYFETREVHFLQEATTYMLDWWRFHEDDGAATRFSWYDMATGIRAMRLAMMIDLLRAKRLVVDPASVDDLLAMAESHIARLREPDFINRGNHGIFQIHGLRLLCAITELKEVCDSEEDYSNGMMLELLNHQFTAEGVHKEDSPTYHFFATKLFGDLVDPNGMRSATKWMNAYIERGKFSLG
jgi:Heparinase II/III N-terminus